MLLSDYSLIRRINMLDSIAFELKSETGIYQDFYTEEELRCLKLTASILLDKAQKLKEEYIKNY